MPLKRLTTADRAKASLQSSISATAKTLIVYDNAAGDAYARLPGSAKFFILTIEDEQILCYGRSGQAVTVYEESVHALGWMSPGQNGRGYAGTNPASHNADTRVSLNVASKVVEFIQDEVDAHTAALAALPTTYFNKTEIAAMLASKNTKDPVEVATTANITLSGLQTIDGISVTAGQRVLVKNQSTGSQNGIYTASASGWTRATDMDASVEFNSALIPVKRGTSNADTLWMCTTDDPTVGTTAITFSQVGASLAKASQAQAEAGTDDTAYMTSLKVAQAITAQAFGNFSYREYGESITLGQALSTIRNVTANAVATGADAYVDSGSATTNFGSSTSLQVSKTSGASRAEVYLRPNFASLTGLKRIVSMTLNIYCSTTGAMTLAITPITSSWVEGSVTWNTKPTLGTALLTGQTAPGSATTWSPGFTVPDQATSDFIVANGIAIIESDSGGTATITFNSREAGSNLPTFDITYEAADGKLYRANIGAVSANSEAGFYGIAAEAGNSGETKKVWTHGDIPLAGLVEGTNYFLGTNGALATSGTRGIGRCLIANRLMLRN